MEYKRLGKTELEVSHISFGGIKLGGVSQELVNQLVDFALESGMNYIDTARVYGQSEEKLGKALQGKRDKFILSTKIINRDLASFKEDFEVCLNNLQTDYVEILFVHDVSTEKEWQQLQDEGVIDYMKELKKEGRIQHLACSTHSLEIGEKMLKSGEFEAVMLAYNPGNTEAEEKLFGIAKENDIGIIIMKPFGGGILTEEGGKELGFDITAKESLKFAASHPDITTVIPGLDKMDYIKQAVEVAEAPLELTAEEKEEIMEKVQIKSEHYCRSCGYCLPCPEGLDIPSLLKLWNRWEAFRGVNWAQMHRIKEEYGDIEKKAEICISCNKCTEKCPYSLPVPKLMEKIMAELG